MRAESDPVLVKRLRGFASASAVFSVAVGLSGLAGWKFHLFAFTTWGAKPVTMKANTALCFVLLGLSLWLLKEEENRPLRWSTRVVAGFSATSAGLVGLLSLVEIVFRVSLGIDQLLVVSPLGLERDSPGPGLMSPVTAGSFLLLSLALLGIDRQTKRGWWPAQFLSLGAGAAATFGLLSFAFDPKIYAANLSLALPTAVTMLGFSLGLVFSRTERGLGALLSSRSLDGSLARRLLPAALIPVLVGWIRWQITATGIYSEWSVVVLASMTTMSLLAGVVAWAAVAVDRSEKRREHERKQAEEQRAWLAAVVEYSDDAIVSKDLNGIVTAWNAGAEKTFGYSAAEMMGQPMLKLFPPGRVREEADILDRIRHGESVPHFETVRVRKDGASIDVSVTISPIKDRNGTIMGASKIARDITERKQADDALRSSRERFNAILESAMDAILTVDEEQHVVLFNAAAEKMFGCPAEEALGRPLTRFIPQRFHAAHAGHIRRFGETGVTNRAMGGKDALWAVRADGEEFQIEASISQVEAGGRKLFTVILRDVTERKLAEEALRRSDAGRRVALEAANLGEWEIDLNTRETRRSLRHAEIFGYAPPLPEWTFDAFLSHVHPDDREMALSSFEASAAGAGKLEMEYRIVRADGEERWIRACGDHYRDPSGEATRMFGTVEDITGRKDREAALRESEERFHAMVNGIPQLAWMAEPDGHIFWYNDRWYEYTGTTFEEMEGWAWQSVHDPSVLPGVLEKWTGAIAAGERFEMEFPLRGADGIFREFLTRVMPLKDAEGHVTRWFGTNTDISERKRAEVRLAEQAEELSRQAAELTRSREALEKQTRMLQLVLDSMSEGLVAADVEGRFLLWNNSASRLLGRGLANLPPEQWSQHYACYLPDGVTPCPMDQLPLLRALRGESLQAELMIQHVRAEDKFWVEFTGRPMKDNEGKLCGGVVAFRDITERRAAGRKIRELNEDLEQKVLERTAQLQAANADMEAFTYSVSHDLRAPLRHISGFSKLLSEEFGPTLPPAAQHHVERIQQGTLRMGLLVDDLLNLARVGRRDVSLRKTELRTVVDELVAELESECAGRQVEWRIGSLPTVQCDPGLMKQVFQNLFLNALKFTRSQPRAVIEVGVTDHAVVFVRDNGVGFDMKYAGNLFGVFQRLHKPEEFEGTGVGLALVQRIVKKHNGRIWAESELNRGATFYFTLGNAAGDAIAKAAVAGGDYDGIRS